MRNLVFIDPATGAIKQTLALPAAAKGLAGAFSAVGLVAAGDRIFATDSQSAVRIAKRKPDGTFAWDGHLALKAPAVGGAAYPTGMALQGDAQLWVCASRGNELQLLNLDDGEVAGPRAGRRRPVHAGRRRREGLRLELGRRPPGEGRPDAHDLRHAGEDRPAHERREPRQRLGRRESRRRVEADEERSRSAATPAA